MNITKSSDWNLECLGEYEETVYDIETENHMFFGNDILVHNSIYLEFAPVKEKFMKTETDRNKLTDFIDKVAIKLVEGTINPAMNVLCDSLNTRNKTTNFDREAICIPSLKTGKCGFWIAKKRYYLECSDMEGYRYEEPHAKIMGLYCVQSSCPEILVEDFEQICHLITIEGVEETRSYLETVKKKFFERKIEEIAFPKSVSDVTRYTDPKTDLPWNGLWYDPEMKKQRNGGVPIQSSSSIFYNYLVKKLNLHKKYQYIQDGDKIMFVYLKENPYGFKTIAFKDELPPEFNLDEYIDKDVIWEKVFLSPVEDIFTACGYTLEPQLTMDDFF